MSDLTVRDLIEQLKNLPQDAIVVRQDYDTSYYFGIVGFGEDAIMDMKYVEDIKNENPLIDWSRYEEAGDVVCVRID